MPECQECIRKDRIIRMLHDTSEGYRHDAELWKKHHFHTAAILRSLYFITKDAMWYPSNFKERGESGHITSQPYIDIQKPSVETDK